MKSVLVATAFLTRVHIPVLADAKDVGSATRWFPLVGGALGGMGALVVWLFTDVLDTPPALTAMVVVSLAAWVSGGIHLDGLADTADGFCGGRNREDVLRIMRDPVIGSYGAMALVLVIGMKVAALSALLDRGAAMPFVVAAPAISRWTIPVLAAVLPYARAEGGLGQTVTEGRDPVGFVTATAITALIAASMLRLDALIVLLVAGLAAAWVAHIARRRIGGVTGDVFGASVELSETMVLVCGVMLTGLT